MASYLAVMCSVSGFLHLENSELDSTGDAVILGACLARLWIHVLHQFWLSGSHVFDVWVLHAEYYNWILRQISFRWQCLARQSIHVLHQYGDAFFDDLHIFSNLLRVSPFSRRMEKCAQQMLHSSVVLAMRALGNLDIISNFTSLAAVMMVRIFWGTDRGAKWCRYPGSQTPGCSSTRCTIKS